MPTSKLTHIGFLYVRFNSSMYVINKKILKIKSHSGKRIIFESNKYVDIYKMGIVSSGYINSEPHKFYKQVFCYLDDIGQYQKELEQAAERNLKQLIAYHNDMLKLYSEGPRIHNHETYDEYYRQLEQERKSPNNNNERKGEK